MKLTILGCQGPAMGPGGACSSYLVQHGGTNLLIDMGNGSLAELQRHIGLGDMDAIILSHLHHDHISDLFVWKYAIDIMRSRGAQIKRQTVFLPGTPAELAKLATAGDTFDVVYISDGAMYTIGELDIAFQQVCHPVESYGVSVSAGGKRLVYSGDTNATADLGPFVAGADLFLADGGLLERHGGEGAPHMTVREACQAGAEVAQTVVTHLSPLYTREEIAAELTGNSILAEQGQVFEMEHEAI